MITIEIISKNISNAIKHSGLTQKEIGAKLGVSQQTISHYCKGDKLPSIDTLANLCVILDVSPADILSEKPF